MQVLNKEEFIKFVIENNILKFGNFTLKSGKKSPYFFNTGGFNTGNKLEILAYQYVKVFIENNINLKHLFGPAYKGIPLVSAISICYNNFTNKDISYSFNRKEEKDHGEGGNIIGAKLTDKDSVWIIDDVITSGMSIKESLDIIMENKAYPEGVVVTLDRQEKLIDNPNLTTISSLKRDYQLQIFSILTLDDIINYLDNSVLNSEDQEQVLTTINLLTDYRRDNCI